MVLTEEQANQIKKSLLSRLENFPEDRRKEIVEKVNLMSTPEVENFIKENKLTHLGDQCIFCSIVSGKNPSFKIAENAKDIAILEITPLSKGHVLIVPKNHEEGLTDSSKELTKFVADILKSKFSPQEIKINTKEIMNHKLIEIIPIYGDEKERSPTSEETLIQLQNEILSNLEPQKKEISLPKEKPPKPKILPKLKPRIP